MERAWNYFSQVIFKITTDELLFNQYKHIDPKLDKPNGNVIRQFNLKLYFESFKINPAYLLLGEAPGPNGCRFSGIPFTSERQLVEPTFWLHGVQSSSANYPYEEMSGRVLWNTLSIVHEKFFIYNAIPFHPFLEGNPLSIRTPKAEEIERYTIHLRDIVQILKPEQCVAIGRVAEKAFKSIGINNVVYARHMSHGGETAFVDKMREIFNLPDKEKTTQTRLL